MPNVKQSAFIEIDEIAMILKCCTRHARRILKKHEIEPVFRKQSGGRDNMPKLTSIHGFKWARVHIENLAKKLKGTK